MEWNTTLFYVTKETDYSTTSINNEHGDKHSNMPGFVLKSLFCFSWRIICCHVMYNCSPFKDSDRWRYCICQKISPQAFTLELQCCRSKHIPSAKNSMCCCLSLCAIASCALSSAVNVQPLRACFIGPKTWKSHGDMSRLYAGYLSTYHGMAFNLSWTQWDTWGVGSHAVEYLFLILVHSFWSA